MSALAWLLALVAALLPAPGAHVYVQYGGHLSCTREDGSPCCHPKYSHGTFSGVYEPLRCERDYWLSQPRR